jgi:hypothetical protein
MTAPGRGSQNGRVQGADCQEKGEAAPSGPAAALPRARAVWTTWRQGKKCTDWNRPRSRPAGRGGHSLGLPGTTHDPEGLIHQPGGGVLSGTVWPGLESSQAPGQRTSRATPLSEAVACRGFADSAPATPLDRTLSPGSCIRGRGEADSTTGSSGDQVVRGGNRRPYLPNACRCVPTCSTAHLNTPAGQRITRQVPPCQAVPVNERTRRPLCVSFQPA